MFENNYFFENDYFIIKNKPIERKDRLYLENPDDLIFKYKIGSGMLDAIIKLFKDNPQHKIMVVMKNKNWWIPSQKVIGHRVETEEKNFDLKIYSCMSDEICLESDWPVDVFKNGLISISVKNSDKNEPEIVASIIIEDKRLYFDIEKMLFKTEFNKMFFSILLHQYQENVLHIEFPSSTDADTDDILDFFLVKSMIIELFFIIVSLIFIFYLVLKINSIEHYIQRNYSRAIINSKSRLSSFRTIKYSATIIKNGICNNKVELSCYLQPLLPENKTMKYRVNIDAKLLGGDYGNFEPFLRGTFEQRKDKHVNFEFLLSKEEIFKHDLLVIHVEVHRYHFVPKQYKKYIEKNSSGSVTEYNNTLCCIKYVDKFSLIIKTSSILKTKKYDIVPIEIGDLENNKRRYKNEIWTEETKFKKIS